MMQKKFEMSSMGEMNFFLELQVKQMPTGIFIHQTKYVNDLLSRFKMVDAKPASTSLPINHGIGPDERGDCIDPTLYRSMIGSLMYLTASRLNIMYATYPRDDNFKLLAYSDSDYGSCKLNAKSTTTGCQFFGTRLVTWQCKK